MGSASTAPSCTTLLLLLLLLLLLVLLLATPSCTAIRTSRVASRPARMQLP